MSITLRVGQLKPIEDLPPEEMGDATLITGHTHCPKCRAKNYYVVAKVTPPIKTPAEGMKYMQEPFAVKCAKCGEVTDMSNAGRTASVSLDGDDHAFTALNVLNMYSDDELLNVVNPGEAGIELARKFVFRLSHKKKSFGESIGIVAAVMFELGHGVDLPGSGAQATQASEMIDLLHRVAKLYAREAAAIEGN